MTPLYYGGFLIRERDVEAMRAWLDDCRGMWDDIDEDGEDTIAELSSVEVVDAVCRHYQGSLRGWFADDAEIAPLGGALKPSEW